MNAADIDHILRGQTGIALGVLLAALLSGGITYLIFRFVVKNLILVAAQQIIEKLDAQIRSNLEVIEATDRQTRVVGNLLMETAISDLMKQRGRDAIAEVTEAEAKRKK